eukprot:Partr_v1_DN28159_c4_g1_i6_m56102 putative glutamine amidotransferase
MCRFLLFTGRQPITLADLLTKPAHSIINQSFDSKLRLDLHRPLNGDGFGVGWYDTSSSLAQISETVTDSTKASATNLDASANSVVMIKGKDGKFASSATSLHEELEKGDNGVFQGLHNAKSVAELNLIEAYTAPGGPCVFTSILPAWNNLNLIRLSEKIRSRLVFAHVRAASPGFPISETNCHPWSFGKFLWMHNGYISSFRQIKRKLQSLLRNDMYHFVQGNTDSEWVFALFLNQFDDPLHGSYKYEDIRQALLQTISTLNGLLKEASITETSLMNFAVTDGVSIVCTRYVNSCTSEPASLFYSSGSKFEAVTPGVFRMAKADKKQDIVIISSGIYTFLKSMKPTN